MEVAREQHVHVHPHAAVVVEHEEAERVPVDPRAFVVQPGRVEQPVNLSPAGERGHVDLADLKVAGPLLEVWCNVVALGQCLCAVCPEDEL